MNTNTSTPIASCGKKSCHFDGFVSTSLKMLPVNKLPTEHEEQRSFVSLWRKCGMPRIFAIPNGEARGIAAARRLKAEGVSRGIPDLFCPEWRLWIEFKRQKGGNVSPEQAEWHQYLVDVGYTVIVCRGAVQGVDMVREFMEVVDAQIKN